MFFINPFIYGAGADFESIATVTVGSGGAANIEFTSIPSTYQHLQIRGVVRSTSNANEDDILMRVGAGSLDTGSNYVSHMLRGTGAVASATSFTPAGGVAELYVGFSPAATATASAFAGFVMDILDYTSTSKNTVMRTFVGHDRNGAGQVQIRSGLWLDTSAIQTIRLYGGGNFAQHTTFSLYGLKAPA